MALSFGDDYCIWVWKRRGMCFTLEKRHLCICVGETWVLLVFLSMMFEICNCDLTHGRYVIGGGTGELPPKEMNISVLGCVAC